MRRRRCNSPLPCWSATRAWAGAWRPIRTACRCRPSTRCASASPSGFRCCRAWAPRRRSARMPGTCTGRRRGRPWGCSRRRPTREQVAPLLQHVDNDVAAAEALLAGLLGKRDQWRRHLRGGAQRAELERALGEPEPRAHAASARGGAGGVRRRHSRHRALRGSQSRGGESTFRSGRVRGPGQRCRAWSSRISRSGGVSPSCSSPAGAPCARSSTSAAASCPPAKAVRRSASSANRPRSMPRRCSRTWSRIRTSWPPCTRSESCRRRPTTSGSGRSSRR